MLWRLLRYGDLRRYAVVFVVVVAVVVAFVLPSSLECGEPVNENTRVFLDGVLIVAVFAILGGRH